MTQLRTGDGPSGSAEWPRRRVAGSRQDSPLGGVEGSCPDRRGWCGRGWWRPVRAERGGWREISRMNGCGASSPLRAASAKVCSQHRLPTFWPSCSSASSCPKPVISLPASALAAQSAHRRRCRCWPSGCAVAHRDKEIKWRPLCRQQTNPFLSWPNWSASSP